METFLLFSIAGGFLALVGGGMLYALRCEPKKEIMPLMDTPQASRKLRKKPGREQESDIERIKKLTGSAEEERTRETITKKLYRAGFFLPAHRRWFLCFQLLALVVWPILTWWLSLRLSQSDIIPMLVGFLGIIIGYIMPLAWLDRKIRLRVEDTLYYLPIVIEQISIGVSGSLDIGPCIAQVVDTADERDSHNPVTEMFILVEKLMRSGLSLEQALFEVAETNGLNEVKHAFMFLAQCSKHGGEVSKQLQDLADAVMIQRQVQVEAKITALPVKATGPLTAVFAGFFGLLFAGLFVRLANAFG